MAGDEDFETWGSCEMYGHEYEPADNGEMVCEDCGDAYTP